MYHHRFADAANAAAIQRRFAAPRPVDPCRHCRATAPCPCGEEEAMTALRLARELAPRVSRGPLRVNHADLVVAIEDAATLGRILDFRSLEHRCRACARTASFEGESELAAAFEHAAQAALAAAEARPR